MRNVTLVILVLAASWTLTSGEIILTTCARMDIPILSKVARAACIVSCKGQNCGTGYCQKRRGRPVCVCSRCASGGGEWPNIPSRGRRSMTFPKM